MQFIIKTIKMLKQKPALILLNICALKLFGFKTTFYLIKNKINNYKILNRPAHYEYNPKINVNKIYKEIEQFSTCPLISILLLVHQHWQKSVERSVRAVLHQMYTRWELIIIIDQGAAEEVNTYIASLADNRISVIPSRTEREMIEAADNAIAHTSGELVCLLDENDELTVDALYEVVKEVHETGAEFIYPDHDHSNENNSYVEPQCKPGFSPDLLLSYNYIGNTLFLKHKMLVHAGGLRSDCMPSYRYDLTLRIIERTDKIAHVAKFLYHRHAPAVTLIKKDADAREEGDADRKALESTLKRRGINGLVYQGAFHGTYRCQRAITEKPLVSIIIPFRDEPEYLEECINSIVTKSTYEHFEIIGIDNQSTEEKTRGIIDSLKKGDERIHFHSYQKPFNYAAINNYAVTKARGEHIVLLNSDIEIITRTWIEALLEHSQRKEVGAVGAKLYYKDGSIQHAGVIIGLSGIAGHIHRYYRERNDEFNYRLCLVHNVSAVTGALLMTKKDLYLRVKGMDEEHFPVGLNDIDFCLRLIKEGFANIMTPYCEAYHQEATSRGLDENVAKVIRFYNEAVCFKKRHAEILYNGDPYYNKNLPLFKKGLY